MFKILLKRLDFVQSLTIWVREIIKGGWVNHILNSILINKIMNVIKKINVQMVGERAAFAIFLESRV